MKGFYGILALAVMTGAVGCQSSGTNTMSQNDTDHPMMAKNDSAVSPGAGVPMDVARQRTDPQFLADAAASGKYEVEAGQLAVSKGSTDNVRTIGQRMVDDHTKANNAVMGLQKKEGVPTEPVLTADQQSMLSKLNSAEGAAFDQEYLKQQEAGHREAIAMFEQEARGGNDSAVKSFASKTLPTLRDHLRMITGKTGDMRMGTNR